MRALAQAVIRSAVMDLFSRTLAGATGADMGIERHFAMRFLTATGNDAWAQSRRDWCLLADVDPDQLRGHIVDVLEGRRDIEPPEGDAIYYRLNGHDIARQMWADEKARYAAYLDDARRRRDKQESGENTPRPSPPKRPEFDVETQVVEALRNGRETVREVGFDVPSAVIRETLDRLVARGLVEKDGPRYRLVPQTTQPPPASVLLDAIPTT